MLYSINKKRISFTQSKRTNIRIFVDLKIFNKIFRPSYKYIKVYGYVFKNEYYLL